jgi:hypothetical protein
MLKTTLGQILINDALPPDMRDHERVLTKKKMGELATQLAEKYPDQYRQVMKKLHDIGKDASYTTNGLSFGLKHIRPTLAVRNAQLKMQGDLQKLFATAGIDDKERDLRLLELASNAQRDLVDKVFTESHGEDNPLAQQVHGVGRGNKFSLNSLIGADMQYLDHRGEPIPIPVTRGYGQGLRPVEYFAGAFGTRKGVMDLKTATADAGFFGKQLTQMTHRLLVTQDDDDDEERNLTAHDRGMPTDVDDPDNEGAMLSRPVGPYKRNTLLTPKILRDMKQMGVKDILVRSPLVGGPADGGVYARDVGYREKHRLPPIGDYVGIAAAQALCLAEGTRVRMADGSVKEIERIVAGDVVLGCSIAGVVQPVPVLAQQYSGDKECVRVLYRRGTGAVNEEDYLSVIGTQEHKILTEVVVRTNKAAANRLAYFDAVRARPLGFQPPNAHDYICAKLSTSFDDTDTRDEPYALLAGILTGDGCLTTENAVRFTCYDTELANDLPALLRPLGFSLTGAHPEYRIRDEDSLYMKEADGEQYRNRLKQWLRAEGLWGCYAHEKHLPRTIWEWSNSSIRAYIAGMLSTDGYVMQNEYSNGIGFGATSRELITGIKTLLAVRFGIYGSAVRVSQKKADNARPMYVFTINAGDMVQKLADFYIPGVKHKKLLQIIGAAKKTNDSTRARFVRKEAVGVRPTYDIYIAHPDHLFLLENGLVVSNSEPVTQSQISSKHSGGVGGAGAISGFKALNALVQVPKKYPGGATHTQVEGRVQEVRPAPQGGFYVQVNGQDHYVPADREVSVKKGDELEAGDVISSGMPNPAEVVRHKGIGEGRRYFVQAMQQVMKNSGISSHRRNVELLSRGLINHVKLTDEYGDYVPDDIVPYSALERSWTPRTGAVSGAPQSMVGHYLEQPVLHYSIGTKIGKNVAANLNKYGITTVQAHKEPAPFEPEMVRGMSNISNDPDWMTRMLGSYQEKGLTNSVHRGLSSDAAGSSYVPALARGDQFGVTGTTSGWKP